MKKFCIVLKNAILMSIFSSIFLIFTVFIYNITTSKILYRASEEKKILLKQVLSKKIYNTCYFKLYSVKHDLLGNKSTHDLWILFKNKKPTAAVVESIAPDGYSGSIHILVASYFNGKIIGVRVISHKETPGIGDKIDISISNWITFFHNMHVLSVFDRQILLKKFGGEIEQFTGATITPQAVTNAIKRTVLFIKKIPYNLIL